MTQLAQDTFIRVDQSGFGTASDGSTWSHPLGSATLSIAGNEGLAQSGGVDDYMLIGSGTSAPVNVLCRCRTDSNGDNVGVIARYASGPTVYRALKNSQTFYLQAVVSGSITTLGSTAYAYGATDYDWIRLVCQGSTITATIWRDGTSEPGSPTLSATDSSISAAGQYGLTGLNGGGTNYYDHLTVTDNSSSTTNTRTMPVTAALLQTSTRTTPVSAALLATSTRVIPVSAALLQTSTRALPVTAALLLTSTRILPMDASLVLVGTRSIPLTVALKATGSRTIPVSASLSGVALFTYNARVYIRSGNAIARVRSGEVILEVRA